MRLVLIICLALLSGCATTNRDDVTRPGEMMPRSKMAPAKNPRATAFINADKKRVFDIAVEVTAAMGYMVSSASDYNVVFQKKVKGVDDFLGSMILGPSMSGFTYMLTLTAYESSGGTSVAADAFMLSRIERVPLDRPKHIAAVQGLLDAVKARAETH